MLISFGATNFCNGISLRLLESNTERSFFDFYSRKMQVDLTKIMYILQCTCHFHLRSNFRTNCICRLFPSSLTATNNIVKSIRALDDKSKWLTIFQNKDLSRPSGVFVQAERLNQVSFSFKKLFARVLATLSKSMSIL